MVKSTHIVISMILVIFLLLTTTAYSERFVIQDVYEATLLSDGTLQTSLTPINAAGVVGYVCASSDCATVSGTFLPTTTTGADNSIIIEYPTTLQNPNGYGIYFYKPGYAIWEVSANWFGTTTNDPAGPFNAYLSRVEVCRSPIDTFQVINDVHPNQPIMIDVSASLDAVTRSALFHSGELDYVPPALLPYYQVETEITLTITEENSGVVHTETRTINIDFSGEELVQFTWVPTELGQYTAEVSTDVTDAKCKSSMKEYSRKQFGVIPEGPKEFCYLLLNNLSALPTHQEVGSTIGIDVTSIANYFDTLGDLHPLPAELELTVTRLGVVEHTDTLSIPVGNNINDYQTTSWNFVPSRAGEHQITVEGSYLGCPFQNGTNDVVSQSYFVLGSGRPVFLTLPNVILQKDSGLNGDLFDLDDFTSDPENDPLVFNIESETDTTVVDCSIDVDNKIDCFVKPGVVGASDVTVSVTDGTSFEYQTFTVTVNGTVTTQCSDLIDNDGDGLVDLADPGCSNPQDDDESDGTSQCQDGFDNDGDGLVDMADPVCSSPQDDDEEGELLLDYVLINGLQVQAGDYVSITRGPQDIAIGLTALDDYTGANYVEVETIAQTVDFDSSLVEIVYNTNIQENHVLSFGQNLPADTYAIRVNVYGRFDRIHAFEFYVVLGNAAQCSDNFDNDGDGLVDMADPGCSNPQDDDESDGTSQCQDNFDNDGDGLVDMADPGCSNPQDDDESDGTSQCQDGFDNDGDGLVDMADPGCSSPQDDDESDGTSQCQDGFDNDGDGLVDMADPGCSNPQDDDESDGTSQCQDGFDNDGDGLVDLADPGCSSPQDDKEYTPKVSECRDGIDNDGDGDIDSDDAACQRGMQHENEDPLAEEGLFISNIVLIDSNGYSSPGSLGAFSIHVRNNGASSMKNVKIVVTVPDFGLRGSAGPFTLDKGSATTRKIYMWDADVLEPGIYDARVTIYSEGSIRIKHREFVVE